MARRLLEGKTIIVTGTSRGIGKKMLERFSAHGASVFALARTETVDHRDFCREMEKRYEVDVIPIYFELTDYEVMKKAIKKIRLSQRTIDGLVNNAGISPALTLMQMTPVHEIRDVMETNYVAPYVFTKQIVKWMMRNRKGSVVNIASIRGVDSYAGASAYAASKSALIMMTKSLAEEAGAFGIRANTICPGLTETGMIASLHDNNRLIEKEATPLGKFAKTDDIADTAVFLLSDLSGFITGQTIRVDGGVTSMRKREIIRY